MDGGLRGGGYGPIFIFAANAPSFSRTKAHAADSTDKAIVYFNGTARAKVATAAARATKVSTRSAFRALPIFAKAPAHDLQLIVCEW